MGMFRCDECGSVENTALSLYWLRPSGTGRALCSACDPAIGTWHGKFAREQYDASTDIVLNPPSSHASPAG